MTQVAIVHSFEQRSIGATGAMARVGERGSSTTVALNHPDCVTNTHPYGFLDLPFMMAEIWKRRWLAIRGLGEHAHYAVPLWRDLPARRA